MVSFHSHALCSFDKCNLGWQFCLGYKPFAKKKKQQNQTKTNMLLKKEMITSFLWKIHGSEHKIR